MTLYQIREDGPCQPENGTLCQKATQAGICPKYCNYIMYGGDSEGLAAGQNPHGPPYNHTMNFTFNIMSPVDVMGIVFLGSHMAADSGYDIPNPLPYQYVIWLNGRRIFPRLLLEGIQRTCRWLPGVKCDTDEEKEARFTSLHWELKTSDYDLVNRNGMNHVVFQLVEAGWVVGTSTEMNIGICDQPCECFDDETNGHFTGEKCDVCKTNYHGNNCDFFLEPPPAPLPPTPAPPPVKGGNGGLVFMVVVETLALVAIGGAFVYVQFVRGKRGYATM